ncbi:MAG: endo-1,4-beta-xylanase [bacterium]
MTLQGTGEEWRDMDGGSHDYNSADSQAALARAKANIRDIRMREVEIRVIDRNGKPVSGLPVSAVQTRNAFPVGDQLWELDARFRYNEENNDTTKYYSKAFSEVLNSANALCYWTERPRNDGPKSEDIQGDNVTEFFAKCVDWGLAHDLTMKGHPLFWSIQKCVPEWVKRYDYETQMKFVEVRVRNMVARFKGKVKYWDAINEPMWEPAFKNLPNRFWPHIDPINDIADYIAPIITWAREEDPDACFTINDYGMEIDPADGNCPKTKDGVPVTAANQRKRFRELLVELQHRNAAPNAIGLQSHTGGWLDFATQTSVYDEISSVGLPVHITEFWADKKDFVKSGMSKDEADLLQAEYVRDYLITAYGHPQVGAFFFWGFMGDAIKWHGDRSGHDLTPLYYAVQKLLRDEWMTKEEMVTDRDGVVRFCGHLGDYSLRYQVSTKNQHGVKFNVNKQDSMPLTLMAQFAVSK